MSQHALYVAHMYNSYDDMLEGSRRFLRSDILGIEVSPKYVYFSYLIGFGSNKISVFPLTFQKLLNDLNENYRHFVTVLLSLMLINNTDISYGFLLRQW